jgi:GTP-binding protein LepA
VATPTISYEVENLITKEKKLIYSPLLFPEDTKNYRIMEPWITVKIITPGLYLGQIIQLLHDHEAEIILTENFGDERTSLDITMPLRELMRNFFDEVKSGSSGFASFSYQLAGMRQADVVKMDVLIGDELISAFSKIISRRRVEREAQETAERLKNLIPRQLISIKIQVQALGRILASRSISAMRKDVTDYLYGGDITRKMKLREKQKKGKKRMQKMGKVSIPPEVFLKMMKTGDAD